jgi:4-amino-4-deoxy-L-arabinose transferase-like glycosyltransferase
MATQSWPSFAHTLAAVQPNMELFYLLLKVAVTLTPAAWQRGEFFWRLLPALAGTATIPAAYALARRLFTERVALFAAALVAANEFLVEYSQQARGYTLFVLLLTLSYLALVRWCEEGSRRIPSSRRVTGTLLHGNPALAWYAALTVLGFLTQAFEVIFVLAQLAFVAVVLLRRHALPPRAFLLSLLPLAAVVALRYPLYAAHPDQVAWIPRPTLTDLFHGTRQLVGGDGGIPSRIGDLLLLVVLASAITLIAWAGWKETERGMTRNGYEVTPHIDIDGTMRKEKKAIPRHSALDPASFRVPSPRPLDSVEAVALVVGWFVIPIAVTWAGSQVKPMWVTRYLAPCSVAACLIVAAGGELAVNLVARAKLRPWLYGALALAALVGWLVPLHDYQARPGWEDWRGAAASVNARFQAGDGIVCYDNQWGCDFGFSHYFASFGGPARLDPAAPGAFTWATYARADREAIFARAVAPAYLAPYLARHGRVWVLLGHYSNGAGDWAAGLAWLNAHAHLLSKIIFAGDIEVYLYAAGGNQAYVNHS